MVRNQLSVRLQTLSVNNNDFLNCVESLVLPLDDLEFDSSLITGADNGEHDEDQVPEDHTTVQHDHGSNCHLKSHILH